jgi:hypothetical protein
MDLGLHFSAGYVLVAPAMPGDPAVADGSIADMVRLFGSHYRGLLRPWTVKKPKNTRGFSFHWSNAQAAWDVITANDPTWVLDGAEFLVYCRPDALSVAGKPWTLKDMIIISQHLPPHPGSEFAVGVGAARVAKRYLTVRTGQ